MFLCMYDEHVNLLPIIYISSPTIRPYLNCHPTDKRVYFDVTLLPFKRYKLHLVTHFRHLHETMHPATIT